MTPDGVLRELDTADVTELLHQMVRIRRFEERCVELYSAGEIRGFLHLYIGEEAVAAGVLSCARPDDRVLSTYREHGHALAAGLPMTAIAAELLGRIDGCCHGRGGSMHLFDAARHFYGGNAIVASALPVATGLALADQMAGTDRVTICFFGEGAVAEGEFHEAMNLAALWNLPVLFCCENNLYAMGTALDRSESATDMAAKAAAYQVPSWSADGMDVLEVRRAAARAVGMIRAGGGPVFLELRTYRFRAHSMYDPERYRDHDEVEQWKQRDPIEALTTLLVDSGVLDRAAVEELDRQVLDEVDRAVEAARASGLEPVEDLTRHVYAERPGAPEVWRP